MVPWWIITLAAFGGLALSGVIIVVLIIMWFSRHDMFE